jgi:hypothetical protein
VQQATLISIVVEQLGIILSRHLKEVDATEA